MFTYVSCALFAVVLMGSLFSTLNVYCFCVLCLFCLLLFLFYIGFGTKQKFGASESIFISGNNNNSSNNNSNSGGWQSRETNDILAEASTHDRYLPNDLMALDKRWQKMVKKNSVAWVASARWILYLTYYVHRHAPPYSGAYIVCLPEKSECSRILIWFG